MNRIFLPGLLILFLNCCYAQEFQLAPPMLQYSSAFFVKIATASLKFEQQGTEIFYTTNNDEPTEKDAAYHKPIVIKKNFTTLKAKVFGKGFIPSETVMATFIQDGLKIKFVEQTATDEKFHGTGPQALFDNEGGIADLHNKNFLGYQRDSVEIDITLEKKEKINSVLLDFLQDHGSWIFLPQKIQVFYFDKKRNDFEIMEQREILPDSVIKQSSVIYEIITADKKIVSDKLRIIMQPLQSMPEGHPGKGKQAWLFIDEIKIY